MTKLTAIYLALTVGVFLICQLAYMLNQAAQDIRTAAAVVLLFASMSVVIRMYVPVPWAQAGNPVQDLICLLLFAGAFETTRAKWAGALAIMFFVQLGIHVSYFMADDFSNHARRMYAIKINTLYCGGLLALFLSGGSHVVRNRRHIPDLLRARSNPALARAE